MASILALATEPDPRFSCETARSEPGARALTRNRFGSNPVMLVARSLDSLHPSRGQRSGAGSAGSRRQPSALESVQGPWSWLAASVVRRGKLTNGFGDQAVPQFLSPTGCQ